MTQAPDILSENTTISTGYIPRATQKFLHDNLKRFNVMVCHRRFGKSYFALNELLIKAFQNPLKNPRYSYVAPTYGAAERIAWDYLKQFTKDFEKYGFRRTWEQKLRMEIDRPNMGDKITIQLMGAENAEATKGVYNDGVIIDEFSEMNPIVWQEIIRPTLSDRMGFAIFLGTPKGVNAFYDIYEHARKKMIENPNGNWFAAIFRADETNIIDPGELIEAREIMSEELFAQEFLCSFSSAMVGSYYAKYVESIEARVPSQITSVPYDSSLLVNTYWDLGMSDTTCIWFVQTSNNQHRVIDYLEDSGRNMTYYASQLKAKGYAYGELVLPHDAAVRDLSSGQTRDGVLRENGFKTRILPRQSIEDGIEASKNILSKCFFDKIKCERGLSALRNYSRTWDSKNKIWSSKPLHNWASNGSDAFRTFAMGIRPSDLDDRRKKLPKRYKTNYNVLD